MSNNMNYWVVSPNVTNDGNVDKWKQIIQVKSKTYIGYTKKEGAGIKFANEIKIGDLVLVAQGVSSNKRCYLCGIVDSHAVWKHDADTPKAAQNRKLKNSINKEEIDLLKIDFSGTAFGDASIIPALYKLKPSENTNDKRVVDDLLNAISNKNLSLKSSAMIKEKIDLLEYKKQIILQGPPGTGKTYTAKKIAKQLVGDISVIDHIDRIDSFIKEDDIVSNARGNQYKVEEIGANNITLSGDNIENRSPSIEIIKNKCNILLSGGNLPSVNGLDPYENAIAKFLFKKIRKKENESASNENGEYKIIQFHPSYSYEDFVRGITAKTNDRGQVEYKTENKVLAEFAKDAEENFNNSIYPDRDTFIRKKFKDFKQYLSVEIDRANKVDLSTVDNIFINEIQKELIKGVDRGYSHDISDEKFLELYLKVPDRDKLEDYNFGRNVGVNYKFFLPLLIRFREYVGDQEFSKEKRKKYILIIDEINRANLPSVLGELIYALEYRGESVNSMYSVDGKASITIPENLYIIGTMNTADRSVGSIDYAIKRRFAFVDILPNEVVIDNAKAKEFFNIVSQLFVEVKDGVKANSKYLAPDFDYKDVQIGHSYFMVKDETELKLRKEYEILPLLREYVKDGLLLETANNYIIDKIENFEL